jgi:hypothetical protein
VAPEPFDRCRVTAACEYSRQRDGDAWAERLELWQLGPDRVLLSVVQLLEPDVGTHEVWLSREARSIGELREAFREWARARDVDSTVQTTALRRLAAVLARWRPEFARELRASARRLEGAA